MDRRYLLFLIVVLMFAVGAVSAADNATGDVVAHTSEDTLEKTYFYDEDTGEQDDDTVVTHNVVKYYGDKDTKFKVKVYDDDYNPLEGVCVSFGELGGKTKEKTTNSKGIVYFPINYKVGKYQVEATIDSEDGSGYWCAENTVKIKSTIIPKELVKYSGSHKKFKIKFLDTKGKPLKNSKVKLNIKGKTHNLKTNSKGIVKIKSTRFKVGKHKITAYNPKSGEKRKLFVVVLKKGVHKINIRIDDPTGYFPTKKLKNGDMISTVYETKKAQYNPGVYVESYYRGLDNAKHTKLLKAKFFFKNKNTGKIITKTSSKVRNGCIVIKPIKGYSPYKATVWYKDKK